MKSKIENTFTTFQNIVYKIVSFFMEYPLEYEKKIDNLLSRSEFIHSKRSVI